MAPPAELPDAGLRGATLEVLLRLRAEAGACVCGVLCSHAASLALCSSLCRSCGLRRWLAFPQWELLRKPVSRVTEAHHASVHRRHSRRRGETPLHLSVYLPACNPGTKLAWSVGPYLKSNSTPEGPSALALCSWAALVPGSVG